MFVINLKDASAPRASSPHNVAENDASAWTNSTVINEKDAIKALRKHCNNNLCWGEGPIDKMKIKKLQPTTAYKVKLKIFVHRILQVN